MQPTSKSPFCYAASTASVGDFISMKDKIINNYFYIYTLCYPNAVPFYVGKGVRNRYKCHFKPSKISFVKNIINKIHRAGKEVLIRIVFKSSNENKVFDKEKAFIKKYGRRDDNTGILCNLTDGGEGVAGWKVTDKWRDSQSFIKKASWANKNSVYNSEKAKENRTNGQKKVWKNNTIRRNKVSIDNKKLWSDKNSGFNSMQRSKKVSIKAKEYWKNTDEGSLKKRNKKTSVSMKKLYLDKDSFYHSKSFKESRILGALKAWKNKKSGLHSQERKDKLSKALKKGWENPNSKYNSAEYKEKQSKASLKKWKNPEFRKKVLKARRLSYLRRIVLA